jgi:5-formyltetrahydrofolate cyclo-ligase
MQEKASLRKHYLKLLKEQSKEECARKSFFVAQQFWKLPVLRKARCILFYASMPGEVDTLAMIGKALLDGKQVALPIVEKIQRKLIPTLISSMEEVHITTHGVAEPRLDPDKAVALKDLDAVIVPGLAFDKKHNRLGRGIGYYDRFLSTLPKTTATIGLAFDFQLHPKSLPTQAHDRCLQYIIAG